MELKFLRKILRKFWGPEIEQKEKLLVLKILKNCIINVGTAQGFMKVLLRDEQVLKLFGQVRG